MQTSSLGLILGAVVGLILALTGAGGGILAVPLLVFGLHLPMLRAAPVGLIAVGTAALFGAAIGLRRGAVRYRAAALIGGVGMAAAPLGVRLAARVPNAPLQAAFAVVLGLVAWRMFLHARRRGEPAQPKDGVARPCVIQVADGRLTWTAKCARVLAGTGALSGLLSGLLGVGGGFVIVPALTHFTDLPPRSVLATSLAVIALVSIGGVGGAALQGSVDWDIALPFAVGAVIALLVGQVLAARVAGERLQQAFAVVSAAVAVLLLARSTGLLVW